LSLSDRKYDIIVSDPNDPFMTGAGTLNSREHFELGRSRLNPNGILVQWVPLYQTADREYRSFLKTFAAVFPHSTVWFAGKSVILIGSEKRLQLDPEVLRARMAHPNATATLKRLGMDTPERLLSFLLGDERSLAAYLEDAPLNTDAYPFVEYASAWAILKNTTGSNLREMGKHFLSPDDVLGYLRQPESGNAAIDVTATRNLVQANRHGIDGMIDALEGRPRMAMQKLIPVVERTQDPYTATFLAAVHEDQGQVALSRGNKAAAFAHFEAAVRLAPDHLVGLANLGWLKFLSGDLGGARSLLERAHALFPNSTAMKLRLGAVYDAQGESVRGEALFEEAMSDRPDLRSKVSRSRPR
jgi:spermidine synthase